MRGLYRGFCRNENGTETIVLNGEKIKGDWVQGFLATEYHIIDDTDSFTYFGGGGMDGFAKFVIPETVCEAVIGLTDKNGKQVFEGDIVKNEYKKGHYQYFKIFYCDRTHMWQGKNKYGMLSKVYQMLGSLEVIGNIHDNPKLLEEK